MIEGFKLKAANTGALAFRKFLVRVRKGRRTFSFMIHDLMAKSKRKWPTRTRGICLAPLVQIGNRFKGKNASGSEGQD